MRKKQREVTDIEEIKGILERCDVLRLAFIDGNRPYILPINYGYKESDGAFVFYCHSALEGKKMDLIRANPNNIGFEVGRHIQTKTGDIACQWSAYFESVLGVGRIELAESVEEKVEGLNAIMEHYGFEGKPSYSENMLKVTAVFRLMVTEFSAKQNPMP